MIIEEITSAQNPKLKEFIKLYDSSKERKLQNRFIIEGSREIEAALKSGYTLEYLLFSQEQHSANQITQLYKAEHYFALGAKAYSKIAYRNTTEGVIAVAKAKIHSPESVSPGKNPLVIVLESVEKPGNIGAILRTADAVKADAIIICDPLTDIYNPNIIRSSLGAVFTKDIIITDSPGAYQWLKENNIKIYTAELQAASWYHKTDLSGPSAFVMGSEANGLKPFWRERADARIKIPMLGEMDSLNVSVSTAILCFEAARQREFYFTSQSKG